MFTQTKNKKAVSPMIGYILLVTFVIVLGVAVYSWMKTYVPQEDLNCPDGTSVFINDYSYGDDTLNITLKNNGLFNVGGYFIYFTTSQDQELATRDLSLYLSDNTSMLSPNGVKLEGPYNSLTPGSEETDEFNITQITEAGETIYALEVVPIRWQTEGRIRRIVSCKDAGVRERISP